MSIRTQALSYAKAVDCSIIAAQHGHTIAEEALGFAELMQAASNTSEEARQLYLLGMIRIAQRGEENSRFAWRTFRDVRETLENVNSYCTMYHLTLSSHCISISSSLKMRQKKSRLEKRKYLRAYAVSSKARFYSATSHIWTSL